MLIFSQKQKQTIALMQQHLGIDQADISLDENGELFFNVTALSILRMRLAPDIQILSIHSPDYDADLEIFSSAASITLTDGRAASAVKSAQIGEALPNGKIESITTAENVANARAARAVLRLIAFDPIKEFENFLHGETEERSIDTLSQAEKDRRFIHKIRDDLDMDQDMYRTHLSVATLGQFTSTEKMDDTMLSKCVIHFRALGTASQMRKQKSA